MARALGALLSNPSCLGPLVAVGTLIQVIFAFKRPEELEFDALTVQQWADLAEDDEVIYVIHAMELTANMKRQYRRRLK